MKRKGTGGGGKTEEGDPQWHFFCLKAFAQVLELSTPYSPL